MLTCLEVSFIQASVCFIQFLSSRSGKSSRAWAPRLSLRLAAESIVTTACTIRLSNSSVSTRSEFQISERSERLVGGILRQLGLLGVRRQFFGAARRGGAAEHHEVDQRVGAEAVGAM